MVVLCCIVVVTGFLPFLVSRSSLSSPPSQVYIYFQNIFWNLNFLLFLFAGRILMYILVILWIYTIKIKS